MLKDVKANLGGWARLEPGHIPIQEEWMKTLNGLLIDQNQAIELAENIDIDSVYDSRYQEVAGGLKLASTFTPSFFPMCEAYTKVIKNSSIVYRKD